MVALCDRLGWVVQEDSQPAGAPRSADLSQRIGERHRAHAQPRRVGHGEIHAVDQDAPTLRDVEALDELPLTKAPEKEAGFKESMNCG